MSYYIGLISGTSVDSVDAVLVDLGGSNNSVHLLSSYRHSFPKSLQQSIAACADAIQDRINDVAALDSQVGELFADAAITLLKQNNIDANQIVAIGSHGQTIRHHPNHQPPFSIQIGDPNIIAARTGITTVADFRRKDIANGGEGAPLAPLLHRALFTGHQARVILNLGGIANITYLPANTNDPVIGFDTGPSNTLLDKWCQQHCHQAFDHHGKWAASGQVNEYLLKQCLKDQYFQQAPPKSTGREYFHLNWLQQQLNHCQQNLASQDIQATLTMLTAKSITDAMSWLPTMPSEMVICGGGVHNHHLIRLLKQNLADDQINCQVKSLSDYHIGPDYVEAMLFAWLAKQTINKQALDLRSITGAKQITVLGGIYYP